MRLKLTKWDSAGGNYSINDGTNYEAVIQPGNSMPAATANFIDLGQTNPVLAGKTLDGGFFTFHIILRGNVETQRDTINKWFRPNDFTFRKLLAEDLDNSNHEWYLEGYPVTPPLIAEGVAKYSITLALKQPFWIEDDENTNTWDVAGAPSTKQITIIGNSNTYPKFQITPNNVKGSSGINHKTFLAIHTGGSWGGTNIPMDVTGSFDTATLVGAGKMLASGYDVGIRINGVYVDRWFGGGGMNSATTRIWANVNLTKVSGMTLKTTLDGSTTPTTIDIFYNGKIVVLPNYGTIQIGSELISYSTYSAVLASNGASWTITATLTQRAAKGSTIAAHAINDTVYWIENDIWLTYGDSTASAPVIDDSRKPVFNLTTSTNSSWVYNDFGPMLGLGGGEPKIIGMIRPNNLYTGTRDAGNTSPADVLGLKTVGLTSTPYPYSAWNESYTSLAWVFSHPGRISNFAATGEKYRGGASSWSYQCVIASSPQGAIGQILYTIVTPTLAATWETININVATSSLSSIYFIMGGLAQLMYDTKAELQSVTLTVATPPTVTQMGVEQVNYKIGGYLANDDLGDVIFFNDLLTKTTATLTIDCLNQEIYLDDKKNIRGMISFGGPKRNDWLIMQPGLNNYTFNDTGTTDLTIVTKWRCRNTI